MEYIEIGCIVNLSLEFVRVAKALGWLQKWPLLTRLLVPLSVVILARVAAGQAAAGIAALLLALGALLRVRIAEGVVGLAVFGGAVALLGGASVRLALAFWFAGLTIIALRAAGSRVGRAFQRGLSGLRDARPPSPS